MGGQSWKQAVEMLAGLPPKPIVYRFNNGLGSLNTTITAQQYKKRIPRGYFEEEPLHGAYKLTVVDGAIVP